MPRELEKEVIDMAYKIGAKNIRVDSTEVYKQKKRGYKCFRQDALW